MDEMMKTLTKQAQAFGRSRASAFQQMLDGTKQERREKVINALRLSRSKCVSEGRQWDLADVMKVLDEEGVL